MIYEDNILYVDPDLLQYRLRIYNKTSNKIRLLLGKLGVDDFEVTIETIKLLPEVQQQIVRNYIKSLF